MKTKIFFFLMVLMILFVSTAIPQGHDAGDAPDPGYPTLAANNGAFHVIVPGFHLGLNVDGEADGQPSPNARGDDLNGQDDADGGDLPG